MSKLDESVLDESVHWMPRIAACDATYGAAVAWVRVWHERTGGPDTPKCLNT